MTRIQQFGHDVWALVQGYGGARSGGRRGRS